MDERNGTTTTGPGTAEIPVVRPGGASAAPKSARKAAKAAAPAATPAAAPDAGVPAVAPADVGEAVGRALELRDVERRLEHAG